MKPRPRIALVVPSLTQGGGVPSVARFIKDTALHSSRFDIYPISLSMFSRDPDSVRFLSPSSWLRGPQTHSGTWDGLSFVHVGAIGGELEFLRYMPRRPLTQAIQSCDIIQVVAGCPAWANTVSGLGVPVALQVATRAKVERRRRHAIPPRHPADWWRRAMTELTDRLDDRALQHVDAIQVENPWMLEYARSLNPNREVDIRYAPPGIDARLFCPDTSCNRLQRRPLSILCVGRLDDPRKNIGLLLESFNRLPQTLRASTTLELAGLCGPPPEFWKRVQSLGLQDRVHFAGSLSRAELVRLYQQSTVFALPSDEEGLGVVLLEAMACGVPAISTRSGGPEGIIRDGRDGFLVPLDDANAMANRLQILLEHPEQNQQMGEEARNTIEQRYSEEAAGQAFLESWDRLLARGRNR